VRDTEHIQEMVRREVAGVRTDDQVELDRLRSALDLLGRSFQSHSETSDHTKALTAGQEAGIVG
jgi:hypothetical protein